MDTVGGPTDDSGEAPDPPRVLARHLRADDTACERRIELEARGVRGNRKSASDGGRYAVASRVEGDARTAHTEFRAARPSDFPTPTDLLPEQQVVYRAAASAYVTLFADQPALALDIEPWETHEEPTDTRIVYNPGMVLAVEPSGESGGHLEVRALRLNRRPLDDIDLALTRLRLRPTGASTVDVVAVELLDADVRRFHLDLSADAERDAAWYAAAVDRITALAARGRERPGSDCRDCAFVARCSAMRGDPPRSAPRKG